MDSARWFDGVGGDANDDAWSGVVVWWTHSMRAARMPASRPRLTGTYRARAKAVLGRSGKRRSPLVVDAVKQRPRDGSLACVMRVMIDSVREAVERLVDAQSARRWHGSKRRRRCGAASPRGRTSCQSRCGMQSRERRIGRHAAGW